MAQELMTPLFGRIVPGIHRPQDAYRWLEDSDDESDLIKPKNNISTRSVTPFSGRGMSSTYLTDLRNLNGKRALQHTSLAPAEDSVKKMKIDHRLREATATDVPVPPPPVHRSTFQPTDAVKQPPVTGASPTGASSIAHTTTPKHPRPTATVMRTTTQSAVPAPAQPPIRTPPPLPPAIKEEDIEPSDNQRIVSTASMPFIIDDSSDDDGPAQPSRASSLKATSAVINRAQPRQPVYRAQINNAQREWQRRESRRRRQQAEERRRATPVSLDAREGIERWIDGSIGDTLPSVEREHAAHSLTDQRHNPPTQSTRKQASPGQDSVVDTSGTLSGAPDNYYHLEKKPGSTAANNAKSRLDHSAVKHNYERKRVQSERDAKFRADLAALEKEKKDVEARKAAEQKKQAEAVQRQRAQQKLWEEHELQVKNRAESAQRSRAIVEAQRKFDAQKKLDAEKEAQSRRQEEESRRSERKEWEDKRRADEKKREEYRKRQAEKEKDRNVLDDQQNALARLSAVRPPQPSPQTDRNAAGTGEDDLNAKDIVAKHTASERGLHFKAGDGSSPAADVARKHVKAIQDRNPKGGLLLPKARSTPAQSKNTIGIGEPSEKDRRVKLMVDRNERMREEQRKEKMNGDQDDGELVLDNDDGTTTERASNNEDSSFTTSGVPKGPQSLSSAAGQALLARNKARSQDKRNHDRALGEILPEDIQLLRWRDTGMTYRETTVVFGKTFYERDDCALRKRYKQVKEAVKEAGVEEYLLDLLMGGSLDAKEKVNRAVHGRWPLGDAAASTQKKGDPMEKGAKRNLLPAKETSAGQARLAGGGSRGTNTVEPARTLSDSFESATTEGTLAHEMRVDGRPTTSGKRIDNATMMYYLEAIAENAEATEAQSEVPTSREPSPLGEDDYRHFAYQVERREIPQERLDDGDDISSELWAQCDEPLDKLAEANKKASKEALVWPKDWEGLDPDCNFQLACETLSDGLKSLSTTWEGIGVVQTRVTRFTRYRQDGILPRSKDGWAPRTIYHVRERMVETSGDDVFAEAKESDVTCNVDNAVYTTLEEANTVAVKRFVALAYTPEGNNLTLRAMQVQDVERKLLRELEDGDEEEFRKEAEAEEGGRKQKAVVWVEEGTLRGPRNL